MGYRNEIDRIGAEIRAGMELDGTFQHAEEEIVCRSYAGGLVACEVASADDTAAKASRSGFADEGFGDVFCLRVAC